MSPFYWGLLWTILCKSWYPPKSLPHFWSSHVKLFRLASTSPKFIDSSLLNSPPPRFSFKSCREGAELGLKLSWSRSGFCGSRPLKSLAPSGAARSRPEPFSCQSAPETRLGTELPREVDVIAPAPGCPDLASAGSWRCLRCFTSGFVQFAVFSPETRWASPPISRCTTTVARRGTGLSPARSSWRGCGPTPTANSNAKRWRMGRWGLGLPPFGLGLCKLLPVPPSPRTYPTPPSRLLGAECVYPSNQQRAPCQVQWVRRRTRPSIPSVERRTV